MSAVPQKLRSEIGHERLDVGASASGLMQRIFEQHVGGGDLVDDTKIDGLAPEFREPTTNDGLVIILLAHLIILLAHRKNTFHLQESQID
jgi:hypothetical protein